jgi:hypothetical protein
MSGRRKLSLTRPCTIVQSADSSQSQSQQDSCVKSLNMSKTLWTLASNADTFGAEMTACTTNAVRPVAKSTQTKHVSYVENSNEKLCEF